MSKVEATTATTEPTTMVDEANLERTVSIQGTFWHHYPAFIYCAIACLGGFQLGIDLGCIAGFQAMPGFLMIFGFPSKASALGWGISPTVQQLISSLMSIGSFVACLAVGPMGKYLSRKWVIFIGCCFNQLGVVLMMVAKTTSTLYVGRILIGVSVGILDVLPQLYIHECAPALQRGSLLGGFNVMVSVGLLIGSIIDNYTSTIMSQASYRIPLGIFLVIPMIIVAVLPFMPETPRWLVEHGKNEQAKRSLIKLRNKNTSPALIEAELEEIKEAFEAEKHLTEGVAFFDCFRKTNLRRTMLSLALLTCLGGSGALLFLVFGTYFFALAGQTAAFQESVGMTAAGLIGTLFSMWLITKIGRRTILLLGFAVQAVCMLIAAVTYTVNPLSASSGRLLVAFTIVFLFFYNMCTAPYLYLAAGEIPTQRLRGYVLGMAVGVGFFWNWLSSYTVPYFINPLELNWGAKYGYIWFASNIFCFIFIYFCVPETKDRTLEEIDELFEEKVSARKFKSYRCVRSERARAVGAHIIEDKGMVPTHFETI